jgi:hypothetical protein
MWKVYLLEFITVLIISIVWTYLIDKAKDVPRDETDELF